MANPDLTPDLHASAEEEAKQLLATQGDNGLRGVTPMLMQQFLVLQTRAQIMLTLTTLTLTITGFSGPKIAASGDFSRYAMVLGILATLSSTLLILAGSLRIRWVTQFRGDNDLDLITRVIRYRNGKTNLFFVEICLLVLGLASYVSSVTAYFLIGL
jgi:hypothetical protein